MFTVTKVIRVIGGKDLVESACLSTDTKPTKFSNGSMCLEMDTGKKFAYDEENGEWDEIENSGGGGGSSDLKNKTTILTFVNDTAYDMSSLEGVRSVINENGLVKITTRSLPQQNATETIETLNIPTDDMGTITLPALPMSATGTYSYVASNAINCELQQSFIPSVVITDDTLDASITLTITFTAG